MNRGPKQALSVFDATCLIVGIIVGAGIYQTSPLIAGSVSSSAAVLGLWLIGGVISFCGAISYAELATTYPDDGGDVVYLRRAYGPWAGFLFGWMQMLIVRPGDIALMAFIFADYLAAVLNHFGYHLLDDPRIGATLAVVLLTGVNWMGIREAASLQNLLTVGKILGLIGIIVIGLSTPFRTPNSSNPASGASTVAGGVAPAATEARESNETNEARVENAASAPPAISVGVALVMVLFCYGGWNEMAYVTAEVQDPRRNILRAMVSGLGLVMALYLLANFSFLRALGKEQFQSSELVAVEVVSRYLPEMAATAVALLIGFSALGAINGLMLAGARIAFAMGRFYSVFARLGQWDESRQTPVVALFVQTAITLVIVFLLGSFDDTLVYTAPTVYLFYSCTTASLLVLRKKDPLAPRAFRHWGYPWTVLLFICACIYMTYSAVLYRPGIALISLGVLLAGLPLYGVSKYFQRSVAD